MVFINVKNASPDQTLKEKIYSLSHCHFNKENVEIYFFPNTILYVRADCLSRPITPMVPSSVKEEGAGREMENTASYSLVLYYELIRTKAFTAIILLHHTNR